GGQRGFDSRQRILHPLDDVERGGIRGFEDSQQRRAYPVLRDDACLHGETVAHLRHIADVHHRAIDLLDRKIVEHVEHFGAAVETDVVFAIADLLGARGQDNVLRVDGVAYVYRGEAFAEKFLWIDVHHDLPRLPTIGE